LALTPKHDTQVLARDLQKAHSGVHFHLVSWSLSRTRAVIELLAPGSKPQNLTLGTRNPDPKPETWNPKPEN